MKPETYEEIQENLEKLKKSLPWLEKCIEEKDVKKITDASVYLVYLLHRIHKKAGNKGTSQSIEELKNAIWWFKMQNKESLKRKFVNVNKLYNEWSKVYDREANLVTFLEEQVSWDFIGKVRGKEVLDLGCGTGRYTIPLAKKGAKVTAIDFTKGMIEIAKKKAKKSRLNINFKQGDITKYNPDKKFDKILSMLVLDHIKDLKKITEVLDKASHIGTKVVISNIHPLALKKDVDQKTGKALGYLKEGKQTDQFFHPTDEYVQLMLQKGFILTKIEDLVYDKKYYSNNKFFEKFEGFKGAIDKPIGIIMGFEKIR